MDRGVGWGHMGSHGVMHVDWLLAATLPLPQKIGEVPCFLELLGRTPVTSQEQILTRSDQVGNDIDSGSLRERVWRVGMCGQLGLCVPRLGLCPQRGYCAHNSQEDLVTSWLYFALDVVLMVAHVAGRPWSMCWRSR